MEEERYSNKVIEYFNNGILRLDEHERGITLRAYLAQKLSCDPMRITKKYTGSSCLGKRVYHAQKSSSKNDEMDRATENLNILEGEFRSRLLQMSKRKRGSAGRGYTKHSSVRSPSTNDIAYTSQWQQQANIMYPYSENCFTLASQTYPTGYASPDGYEQFNYTTQEAATSSNPTNATEAPTPQSTHISEHDSEAASSLLGFFNHLERQSSQQDMRHCAEDVETNGATGQPSSLQDGIVSVS